MIVPESQTAKRSLNSMKSHLKRNMMLKKKLVKVSHKTVNSRFQSTKVDGLKKNRDYLFKVKFIPFIIFLGYEQYGNNWIKLREIIGTRNGEQIRSHAQKYLNKLKYEETQKSMSHLP